ncbi:MAG: hypothetical protein JRM82_02495 [Nitrososphaerota archaeon]|nr:hypothetical protein [Nitrososphaerota archaeon]
MSKHAVDSSEAIMMKINFAYCPPNVVEGNALIEYSRYIVFRKRRSLRIEPPEKYGEPVGYFSSEGLEAAYAAGRLHQGDLRKGVGEALDSIISTIREHFGTNPSANRLYEAVRSAETTR